MQRVSKVQSFCGFPRVFDRKFDSMHGKNPILFSTIPGIAGIAIFNDRCRQPFYLD